MKLLLLLLTVCCFCGETGAFSVSPHPRTSATTKLFSSTQQETSYRLDIDKGATRHPDGFLEWAEYYGITPENFALDSQSNNWRGVATQDAPAGSRALLVPGALRLTSQNAQQEDFAHLDPMQVLEEWIPGTHSDGDAQIPLACHFYLFLKILQEYDQGAESPYLAWMNALPRKFSTALTFSELEMDCLPPFVKILANKDRHNYQLFTQALQQLDVPSISDETKYNSDATQWAFQVVFTRARAAFGHAEIIPMSDMLNHNAQPNVAVQYDDEGNVHMVLQQDVVAGQELYKCYGQPTNPSRYFATFGFFDASPPATYCKLCPDMEPTPELVNLGFDYNRLVFGVEQGEVAPEVWDVVLYLLLETIDPSAQQQFYQAHLQGDDDTKNAIHQHFMGQSIAALLQHIDSTLDELAECQETMDEQGGMGLLHENLPMIRRHNDFVRQTFLKVQKNLQGMM
eukprot:CAMPEP_0172442488 /NCGR_PEP_ID=MMETSP1065-20121228/2889_1 /TAXON_ID=265537 /ORGANISM="Amphiprora paludosa, Strain CCMP125" /LENGTH=455 /DNA_ID=CAMNT_0013192351 /DNA_START=125 /DNA_END=1492 /DNA_ORIENTATION=-